jgi:hypothetical protein
VLGRKIGELILVSYMPLCYSVSTANGQKDLVHALVHPLLTIHFHLSVDVLALELDRASLSVDSGAAAVVDMTEFVLIPASDGMRPSAPSAEG